MSKSRKMFEAFVVGSGSTLMAIASGAVFIISLAIMLDNSVLTFDDVKKLFRKED